MTQKDIEKGLLAPACNDTHNSLLTVHSEDLTLSLGWTNTNLSGAWYRKFYGLSVYAKEQNRGLETLNIS